MENLSKLYTRVQSNYLVIFVNTLFCREEEGIELQVLSSDKKRDIQQNENNSSFGSIEFADFNSTAVKEDVQTTSGTIGMLFSIADC